MMKLPKELNLKNGVLSVEEGRATRRKTTKITHAVLPAYSKDFIRSQEKEGMMSDHDFILTDADLDVLGLEDVNDIALINSFRTVNYKSLNQAASFVRNVRDMGDRKHIPDVYQKRYELVRNMTESRINGLTVYLWRNSDGTRTPDEMISRYLVELNIDPEHYGYRYCFDVDVISSETTKDGFKTHVRIDGNMFVIENVRIDGNMFVIESSLSHDKKNVVHHTNADVYYYIHMITGKGRYGYDQENVLLRKVWKKLDEENILSKHLPTIKTVWIFDYRFFPGEDVFKVEVEPFKRVTGDELLTVANTSEYDKCNLHPDDYGLTKEEAYEKALAYYDKMKLKATEGINSLVSVKPTCKTV